MDSHENMRRLHKDTMLAKRGRYFNERSTSNHLYTHQLLDIGNKIYYVNKINCKKNEFDGYKLQATTKWSPLGRDSGKQPKNKSR